MKYYPIKEDDTRIVKIALKNKAKLAYGQVNLWRRLAKGQVRQVFNRLFLSVFIPYFSILLL